MRSLRTRGSATLLALVLLAWPVAAGSEEASFDLKLHPLEPADTSSPRATLQTFLQGMEKAWELWQANDPAFYPYWEAVTSCLDVSEVPPHILEMTTVDSALLLKEVLDRIELPPMAEIPGASEVEEAGLTRWTVPHTDIRLVRVPEGDREGEFLFSPGTVARSRHDYERVRHLPYQPGEEGAHYDEMRFGSESRFLARIVAGLPAWAKLEYQGQLVWQWAILAALGVLSIALVSVSIALGRRLSRSSSGFGRSVGPWLAPFSLISLQWIIPQLAPWETELGGPGMVAFSVAIYAAAYLGAAWLAAVLIQKAAGLVLRLTGAGERPLHRQLVLVSSKILGVLAIAIVLFLGGQKLGIPVSALLTGLGVGGVAVALAAQSTLENLLGGINLFADRPVQIGHFCKFGDQLGVVEAIGLRSTRIRTLARTVVSIPNSSFAKMELENLSLRDQNLLRTKLRLEYGISTAQLEGLLAALRATLSADERIAEEPFRVRLNDLGRDALEVEVYAYVLTADWNEYLEIREELLLTAMRLVDEAGLRLALPSERHEVVQHQED